MNTFRGLVACQRHLRPCYVQSVANHMKLRPVALPDILPRQFTSTPVLELLNKKIEISRQKTNKMLAQSENENNVINLDTLEQSAIADNSSEEVAESGKFQLYPDDTTPDQLFNGIAFKDLPIVFVKMHKNNTRLWSKYADGREIWYNAPAHHGFLNSKKRTNVAGQVAGLNMGQKLRGLGIRTVRVQIAGFNQARGSVLKGIVQAGIEIVAIADITTVHFDWPQRARKKPRKN